MDADCINRASTVVSPDMGLAHMSTLVGTLFTWVVCSFQSSANGAHIGNLDKVV